LLYTKFPISRDPPEGGTPLTPPQVMTGSPPSKFPISRDPPEGGTLDGPLCKPVWLHRSFQFLGIPPKGERSTKMGQEITAYRVFPISRDPPEGGTGANRRNAPDTELGFPISRDPPEGGTTCQIRR